MSKLYIHKKTGNKYFVTGEAINTTNSQDGQVMVVYANTDGKTFVREKTEFLEKFEGKMLSTDDNNKKRINY